MRLQRRMMGDERHHNISDRSFPVAADAASPWHRPDDDRRAHKRACLPSPVEESDENRRAGHLHSSEHRAHEHRIAPKRAVGTGGQALISATDRQWGGRADRTDRSSQQQQQQWRDPLQWSREHSLRAPCCCGHQSTSVLRATGRRRKAQWKQTRFRRFNPTKRASSISTSNCTTNITTTDSSVSARNHASCALNYLAWDGL